MAPFFSPDVKYKNAPEGDKDAEAELIIPRFPREAFRRCAGLARAVRGLAAAAGVLVAVQALAADPGQPPDWILASSDARAVAGQPFEVLLVSLGAEPPPDEINVRLKGDVDERILRMQALGPARRAQGRRAAFVDRPARAGRVRAAPIRERSDLLRAWRAQRL